MYNSLNERFSNVMKTEICRDTDEVYPYETYERSTSEVAFYVKHYKYFNEILKSLASMEVPFYYKTGTLKDVVLSFYKKNEPCSAEVNLANNLTLKNLTLLNLHKGLKFTTFHRSNTFLEDWSLQTRIISSLVIPCTLKKSLLKLQNCERHSNLVIEKSLNHKSCFRYRIVPNTQAYENIIIKYQAFDTKLTSSLLDSFSMINEIRYLTHSMSDATDLFYNNVNSMKRFIFKEI